jgi:hypothetical protein
MDTSIAIHSKIRALKKQQGAVPDNAKDREAQLYRLDGQIIEAENQLANALQKESNDRGSMQVVQGAERGSDFALQAFGPRAQFNGIHPGYRAAITIPAGAPVADPRIPGFADYPRGFVDSLTHGPTEGSVTYLRRGDRINGAAQWATGDGSKAESSYAWEEVTAPLGWIAHHTPIAKTQASDYGQLDSIIRSEMMIGLAQAKNREALVGSNVSGIVGITNTAGVQTYDPAVDGAVDDTVYDTIRRMATKVLLVSGFKPTHVAMSPMVHEALDLLKGSDKHYLAINVGGKVWNLELVVDVNLTTVDEADTIHNAVIVYAPAGATWYTKETDNVEIGLVDDQFIQNAYTLLAEGRYAMAVRYPDAFCYCEDAIEAVEAAS